MKKTLVVLILAILLIVPIFSGCSTPTTTTTITTETTLGWRWTKKTTTTRRTTTTVRPTTTIKPTTTVKPTTTIPVTTTKSTTTPPVTTIPTTTTTIPVTTTIKPTTTTIPVTTTTIPPVIKNRTIFTKDFGAKGNGIDDDTNALQAAIDLAVANAIPFTYQDMNGTSRITVILEPGVYRTTKPLVFSNREQMMIWPMLGPATIKSEVSPAIVVNNSKQLTLWKLGVESPEIDINISNSQKTTLWDLTVSSITLINSVDMTLMKTSTFTIKDDYSSYYNMDTGVNYPATAIATASEESSSLLAKVFIAVIILLSATVIYIGLRRK